MLDRRRAPGMRDAWREGSHRFRLMVAAVVATILVLSVAVMWEGPRQPVTHEAAATPSAHHGSTLRDWLYYWSQGNP